MARDVLLRFVVSNAVLALVCGTSPPLTTPRRPTTTEFGKCVVDGEVHEPGESWYPDPCTYCHCEDTGEHYCAVGDCFAPQCHDYVYEEGKCCATCPNGENCLSGDTVIPKGETVRKETGEECWCEQRGDWGELEAICTPPASSPTDPPVTPPPSCEYNGITHQPGEEFQPDPCTYCSCDSSGSGELQCFIQDCPAPLCMDQVFQPGQCCGSCPNGPSCLIGDTVYPEGVIVTLESGERCECSEYGEVICMPSERCQYGGQEYEAGESFQPDPCTWCQCEDGEAECAMAGCPAPPCVDEVYDPTQCCPYCPNGPNCKAGDTVIPVGETVTLDSGETCTCQGEEWALEPMCIFPPPPPPTPSVVPDTTTLPPPPPPTTTVNSKQAERQAKQEERQAKKEARQTKKAERQAKKEERQAKKEARQQKKAERQARKAERKAKRAARQTRMSN